MDIRIPLSIVDSFIDGVVCLNPEFKPLYVNEGAATLFGISTRQLLRKKKFFEAVQFEPKHEAKALLDEGAQGVSSYRELHFTTENGQKGRVQIFAQTLSEGNLLLYFRDVTLEERLQIKYHEELKSKDRRIADISMLLNISSALTGLNEKTEIIGSMIIQLESTKRFEHILFHDGQHWYVFSEGQVKKEAFVPHPGPMVLSFDVSTGNHSFGKLMMEPIVAYESHFRGDGMDLLKSIAAQMAVALESARFFEKSITDEMTKLFNKRYFDSRYEHEFERAERSTECLAVIMVDVDHFKKFNDTYGHQLGDLVLTVVAEQLQKSVRAYDIAARYGGEEFIVLLPNTKPPEAHIVAERIRKNIEKTEVPNNGSTLKVTASLGVACAPEHSTGAKELIKAADEALYESKRDGRNRTTLGHKRKVA